MYVRRLSSDALALTPMRSVLSEEIGVKVAGNDVSFRSHVHLLLTIIIDVQIVPSLLAFEAKRPRIRD